MIELTTDCSPDGRRSRSTKRLRLRGRISALVAAAALVVVSLFHGQQPAAADNQACINGAITAAQPGWGYRIPQTSNWYNTGALGNVYYRVYNGGSIYLPITFRLDGITNSDKYWGVALLAGQSQTRGFGFVTARHQSHYQGGITGSSSYNFIVGFTMATNSSMNQCGFRK